MLMCKKSQLNIKRINSFCTRFVLLRYAIFMNLFSQSNETLVRNKLSTYNNAVLVHINKCRAILVFKCNSDNPFRRFEKY